MKAETEHNNRMKTVTGITEEEFDWPMGLKDLNEAAGVLGIAPKLLREFAESNHAPHWRVNNGAPMFKIGELKRWAARNLLVHCGGNDFPADILVNLVQEFPADWRRVPQSIRAIEELQDISSLLSIGSGIYFLCSLGKVVYVGQTVAIGQRVRNHQNGKEFDAIFFLNVPPGSLNRIEGALIRHLKPPLNIGPYGSSKDVRLNCPSESAEGDDDHALTYLKLKGNSETTVEPEQE